jgi:hypothetical protein
MFWFRVLAVAKLALLVRHHLRLLEPDERGRLARLVAQSKGRPRRNLSANERQELLRLVNKIEPGRFGRDAIIGLRGSGRKPKAP